MPGRDGDAAGCPAGRHGGRREGGGVRDAATARVRRCVSVRRGRRCWLAWGGPALMPNRSRALISHKFPLVITSQTKLEIWTTLLACDANFYRARELIVIILGKDNGPQPRSSFPKTKKKLQE